MADKSTGNQLLELKSELEQVKKELEFEEKETGASTGGKKKPVKRDETAADEKETPEKNS